MSLALSASHSPYQTELWTWGRPSVKVVGSINGSYCGSFFLESGRQGVAGIGKDVQRLARAHNVPSLPILQEGVCSTYMKNAKTSQENSRRLEEN